MRFLRLFLQARNIFTENLRNLTGCFFFCKYQIIVNYFFFFLKIGHMMFYSDNSRLSTLFLVEIPIIKWFVFWKSPDYQLSPKNPVIKQFFWKSSTVFQSVLPRKSWNLSVFSMKIPDKNVFHWMWVMLKT